MKKRKNFFSNLYVEEVNLYGKDGGRKTALITGSASFWKITQISAFFGGILLLIVA